MILWDLSVWTEKLALLDEVTWLLLGVLYAELDSLWLEQAVSKAIEERVTIEDAYEPYLIQAGLLYRTQKGRMVSKLGYEHLEMVFPENDKEEIIEADKSVDMNSGDDERKAKDDEIQINIL